VIFKGYQHISKDVARLILAEISLQLVNTAFLFILLIYMQKEGYSDYEGAHFIKIRFLSVLLFSIPIGYYVKGKKIIPLFYLASIVVPISSLLIIYSIDHHINWLLYLMQVTWGAGFVCMQVSGLPYILRNSPSDTITQGISLSHIAWSTAGIVAGFLIFTLGKVDDFFFDEKTILQVISILSFVSLYFVFRMKSDVVNGTPGEKVVHDYDWKIIFRAMIPTAIIAVGAGLTIPFISIFFFNVHQVSATNFAVAGVITLTLVSFTTLFVPEIKTRWGFKKAVPITQSIAVLMLILMSFTELFSEYSWSVYLALLFYILRQPLMNLAAPMTSELTMMYVGEKNREMVSALTASIWSGSWFFSAQMFEVLRESKMPYYQIFLITALLYSWGIFSYYRLIKEYEKRT
jgi:hypothetical protein